MAVIVHVSEMTRMTSFGVRQWPPHHASSSVQGTVQVPS